eukprot:jgi/Botrbrau1/3185/Bobra.37_2s0015.1
MSRRGGHHGFGGPGRQDYTLLREDANAQDIFDVEEGQQKRRGATVWRLMALAKDEVCVLLIATVALFVGSAATVAVPKLAGNLIDICINYNKGSGSEEETIQRLNRMLLEILAILAVGGLATGIRSWLFNGAAERVMWALRNRLFARLINQEIGFFDRVRTGELMNRLSEDTRLMKSAGTISVSIALRSAVVAIFGVVLMFITSPMLSLLTISVLPVLLASFHVFTRLNRKYTAEGLTASAQASTVAEESFGSIRTVRSFAKEDVECERYELAQGNVLKWGLKSAVASGFFFGFNTLLAMGALATVLWFGARQVVFGKMSAGELSSFLLYAIYVGGNVGAFAGVVSSLIQAVGASERVFQLLDRMPRLPAPGNAKPWGAVEGGDVQLRDVWFAYPSRPDVHVLKGVTLRISPGKRVALVGPSGGGKSTVVNLIMRFYDPNKGSVLLDGIPLPQINHRWLHRQVSIVSQEPVLFAETIFYNIAFGVEQGRATLQQVEEAAKLANAHDFIMSFPQGYNTSVGERGVRLSGGQKQRVAIARAIMTEPRVLLLDEATSALDAESEALVQQALDRVVQNRTVLVIAHRLSTVQSANEVMVMSGGVIAERGTHLDLLSKGGVYAMLVRRQLQGGHSSAALSVDVVSEGDTASSPMDISSERRSQLGSRKGTESAIDDVLTEVINNSFTNGGVWPGTLTAPEDRRQSIERIASEEMSPRAPHNKGRSPTLP